MADYWQTFKSELRAGKFAVYAQWWGCLSIPFCILFSILGGSIGWKIATWFVVLVITLFEVPLCLQCFRDDSFPAKCITFCSSPPLRFIVYTACAVLLYFSGDILIQVGATFVLLSGVCYGIASLRREEGVKSVFISEARAGAQGAATNAAVSRV